MEIAFTIAPPPPFSGVFIVPPFLFWFVFNLLASKMHDTSGFLVMCDTCKTTILRLFLLICGILTWQLTFNVFFRE